jgi:hypothetical protein
MKWWATQLIALDPEDGKIKRWQGQHVPGLTFEDAEKFIKTSGMGYLVIVGQLIVDSRKDADPYKINMN